MHEKLPEKRGGVIRALEPEEPQTMVRLPGSIDVAVPSQYQDPDPVVVPPGFSWDPEAAFEKNQPSQLTLRATDQETARVVAVHRPNGEIVGSGCLVDNRHILTCLHVVEAALHDPTKIDERKAKHTDRVFVTLPGVTQQPTVEAELVKIGGTGPENDLALLKILDSHIFQFIQPVEFASPLRHGGKDYSVLGFPGGDRQGRNAVGRLHAADARNLVQMDRGGALSVLGGFSGAPVWSSDLNAFVGLVVTEYARDNVSWCIPSRRLCQFHSDLHVRFRVPPMDRPVIHDSAVDDPNRQLFGELSDNGQRRLSAVIREQKHDYIVNVYYECAQGSPPPRGHYVSFITYPNFKKKREDAYELFAEVKKPKGKGKWIAEQEFYPDELFTVAAIGDAGDTVLTINLEDQARTTWK
jgi:hypothetical protein